MTSTYIEQKNIVCLISGRGSNLDALLRAAQTEQWEQQFGARIACVISNRSEAFGLKIAADAGVPTAVVDHSKHASRESFDAALAETIDAYQPKLIVLAGFMRVLTAAFVERYAGRLINVHPSLLPAFPGLATHRQALAAGVRLHGATVHFVSTEVDAGAVIAQAAVCVLPGDTEETLAARVLEQEHLLLPRCVRWFVEGKVALRNGCAVVNNISSQELAWLAA